MANPILPEHPATILKRDRDARILLTELREAVRMLKAWDKEYGSQATDIARMEAAIKAAS